ncbi:MAG: hypothetical protein IJN54_15170 [Lachnospiraceae bacterium]|nr:hypothetical protein [Lachnospiraceae bacterium]
MSYIELETDSENANNCKELLKHIEKKDDAGFSSAAKKMGKTALNAILSEGVVSATKAIIVPIIRKVVNI